MAMETHPLTRQLLALASDGSLYNISVGANGIYILLNTHVH